MPSSRRLRWVALFLAASSLMVGGYLSAMYAIGEASVPPSEVWSKPALIIQGVGTVPLPPGFDRLTREERDELVTQLATSLRPLWWANFSKAFGTGLVITLAASLAVYAVVRAVGWAVGRFGAM